MNITLILIGVLLILDTIFILGRSNVNMGVLMPALLGIPLLILGLVYAEADLWLHQGVGIWFYRILIVGYATFALIVLFCTALIRREIRRGAPKNADVIIVLGAAVHGTKPSLALQNRLHVAADYLRENENCIAILSGGRGPQEDIAEAEAMYAYMTKEEGIPEERIIAEAEARSTYENFLYSGEIIKERFSKKCSVIFATSDFHIFRAKMAAKKSGLGKLCGIGCVSPFYIVPNYYIRESMAIVRYVFLGCR